MGFLNVGSDSRVYRWNNGTRKLEPFYIHTGDNKKSLLEVGIDDRVYISDGNLIKTNGKVTGGTLATTKDKMVLKAGVDCLIYKVGTINSYLADDEIDF